MHRQLCPQQSAFAVTWRQSNVDTAFRRLAPDPFEKELIKTIGITEEESQVCKLPTVVRPAEYEHIPERLGSYSHQSGHQVRQPHQEYVRIQPDALQPFCLTSAANLTLSHS